MTYTLKIDKEFDKDFGKLDKSIKISANKKLQRLKENPNEIGKHLHYLNIWELHVEMYRIFYFIEEKEKAIFLLAMKHKDVCDKYVRGLTMDEIRQRLADVS